VDSTDLRRTLAALAANHRWTWQHRVAALFERLPTSGPDVHPVVAVRELSERQLEELVADADVAAVATTELAALDAELESAVTAPDVVYYSPEFGISEFVPQYSGGLGVLAGDHLKAASDLGTRLAAVGLFYRQGFFRQVVGATGQTERYETYRPEDLGCEDTGLVVDVPIAARVVRAKVWRLAVGRVPLLLLDTDVPGNAAADRAISDRLYSGDRRHRLEQELVLGVGGARAVAAMGWSPVVHHLNEGHAGFLTLELLRAERDGGAEDLDAAVERARRHVLFTTHTPVPAGIDRFDRGLVLPHLRPYAALLGVGVEEVMALGEDPDDGSDVFNMAALCLRLASRANGVSQLHGEVSRSLFADVPGGADITSVTNGVHARTWVSPHLQDLFDATLGDGWDLGNPAAWAGVARLSDSDVADQRAVTRRALEALLRERTGVTLDPDAFVVGFARRFATYKRATLLLRHPDVLAALLADDERPVHLVFAGKAHPADGPGKALLAEVVRYGGTRAANGRFTMVPDYDMGVARAMYSGCDVWLNTPVRPHEASGTSGEKAALNGAVNCSIRDGWWAEMSDGRNGYDIATFDAGASGSADGSHDMSTLDDVERDEAEAANALAAIASLAAEFHADGTGAPSATWVERMRHVWTTLGPRVTAARMVRDYERALYTPMIDAATR
jgi:starch phosphorylase